MRKLVILVASVSLLGLGACKHGGSSKLEGHWRGVRAEGVTAEVEAKANAFALQTEIVAQGNQIAITSPGAKSVSGTYVVDREEDGTLVIHTDRDGTTETFVFADKGAQMTWKVDAQRSIVFKKAP